MQLIFSGGRNKDRRPHANYGVFVSIRACKGKHVNRSAHLEALGTNNGNKLSKEGEEHRDRLRWRYRRGNMIVGRVHLHTAFYRYPKDNPDGSPYGAQGCRSPSTITSAPRRQGIKVDARVYDYAKATPKKVFCREGIRCGEQYLAGN